MATQVFIQNPDSGEPAFLCGAIDDPLLSQTIGQFAQAEAEQAKQDDLTEFVLEFKLVEMTDEEVAALPDI